MRPDNRYNKGKTLGELLRAKLVLVAVCRRCKHEHILYPALLIERFGESGQNPAEQAGYAKGANAGRAAAIGRIPLTPAALQSDEQANGQGQSEPGDERIHGAAFSRRPSAGGREPT